jgi:predicted nucleotidyltransferase component of viral defense system
MSAKISPQLLSVIKEIFSEPAVPDSFYLAGGTALAMYYHHRVSIDADFFSGIPFSEESLAKICSELGNIVLVEKGTVHAYIHDVKISFLHYPYTLLEKTISENNTRLASVKDIACMKAMAIAQRAEKKDFFDMYEILNRGI